MRRDDPPASWGDVARSLAFYAVFYPGTLLLLIAMLPAAVFDRRGLIRMVRRWSRFQRWCVAHLLGIELCIEGTLPRGRVLVALKHESFFEAIDLPMLLDNPAVFIKIELTRLPLWGAYARRYGLIAVARDGGASSLRAMLTTARARLAEGRTLAIFPEGTRVPHGTVAPLQSGFAGLYTLLALPVVPVAVMSGPCYQRWWKRRGVIRLRFGEAIPPGLGRAEIEARVRAAINAFNKAGDAVSDESGNMASKA